MNGAETDLKTAFFDPKDLKKFYQAVIFNVGKLLFPFLTHSQAKHPSKNN